MSMIFQSMIIEDNDNANEVKQMNVEIKKIKKEGKKNNKKQKDSEIYTRYP